MAILKQSHIFVDTPAIEKRGLHPLLFNMDGARDSSTNQVAVKPMWLSSLGHKRPHSSHLVYRNTWLLPNPERLYKSDCPWVTQPGRQHVGTPVDSSCSKPSLPAIPLQSKTWAGNHLQTIVLWLRIVDQECCKVWLEHPSVPCSVSGGHVVELKNEPDDSCPNS